MPLNILRCVLYRCVPHGRVRLQSAYFRIWRRGYLGQVKRASRTPCIGAFVPAYISHNACAILPLLRAVKNEGKAEGEREKKEHKKAKIIHRTAEPTMEPYF